MATTKAANRTEPGLAGPGSTPLAGPAGSHDRRSLEEASYIAAVVVEKSTAWRVGRAILIGGFLLVTGGFTGVMLAFELLGDAPQRLVAAGGVEAPAPRVGSGPAIADLQRQEASRMQLNAELVALQQAVLAEQAWLETLARQRTEAEAQLAGLLAVPRDAMPPVSRQAPTPAPTMAWPPPVAPAAPVVSPSGRPPPRGRQEARPEARAEPRGEGRVQLHYLAGSPVAQQAAQDAAAALREAGVEQVELRPALGVPDNRVVRYHRSEDAGQAARLAGRLGRGWAVQDSRGYDPGSVGRSLEIWLPDR